MVEYWKPERKVITNYEDEAELRLQYAIDNGYIIVADENHKQKLLKAMTENLEKEYGVKEKHKNDGETIVRKETRN